MGQLRKFDSGWKDELHSLLEKKIQVGDGLKDKLKKLSPTDTLAKKMLDFFSGDEIKDDAKVAKLDYSEEDEKLLTVIDDRGRARKFKFGKLLNYLGYDSSLIKPYEVSNFMLNFKKSDTENLKLVSGKDILKAYHCKNYDDTVKGDGDSLNFSCMRFDKSQNFLEIYTSNPNQVKCLVLLNPETKKVQGRALIWTMKNGGKFMDRVYTASNELKSHFLKYADNNNIERSPSADVILDNGGEFDHYPYLDTLMHYTPSENRLSANDGELSLTSTEGGGGGQTVWSDFMMEEIQADEAVHSDTMNSWIYRHDATEVIIEVKDGKAVKKDWIISDEVTGHHAVEIDYTSKKYSELKGEHALESICVELENGPKHVLNEDSGIYEDGAYGVFVRVDMVDEDTFIKGKVEDFAIEVTWNDSGEHEEYIPIEEACSAYSMEWEKFVTMNYNEDWYDFIESEEDNYPDYEAEDGETDPYMDVDISPVKYKYFTEKVFIHNSFIEDDEGGLFSESFTKDAPFFADLFKDTISMKGEGNKEIHDGIYVTDDIYESKTVDTKGGKKIFPPLVGINYDRYEDYIKSLKSGTLRYGKHESNPEHKYYVTALREGKVLESGLINRLEDSNFYTIRQYRGKLDINNPKGMFKIIQSFINENYKDFSFIKEYDKVVEDKDFYLKEAHVSFFGSYYFYEDGARSMMIFPFMYSDVKRKYPVYVNDKFTFMDGSEIINYITKTMFD